MTANANEVTNGGDANGHVIPEMAAEPKTVGGGIRPFVRAPVNFASPEKLEGCIHSLPELVDFNAVNNESHPFCVQAKATGPFDTITHGEFKVAVLKCAEWIRENLPLQPTTGDKALTKMAPVALFMESDIGLAIHEFALMSIGVPVSFFYITSIS
jgi:hypothetical protein